MRAQRPLFLLPLPQLSHLFQPDRHALQLHVRPGLPGSALRAGKPLRRSCATLFQRRELRHLRRKLPLRMLRRICGILLPDPGPLLRRAPRRERELVQRWSVREREQDAGGRAEGRGGGRRLPVQVSVSERVHRQEVRGPAV